jgi:protease-4
VGAGVSNGLRAGDDLLFQFSLALNAEHLGLTYAIGASSSGLDHLVAVRASMQKYPPLSVMNGKVAMFDLGDLMSGSQNPALSLFGIHAEDPYLRLTRMLDLASRDDRLRGVVLKIDNIPTGLGRTQELRDAIFRLRAAGKTVIAVLLMAGDSEYLIASACDRIYAVPQAILMVNGFAAHTTFLGTAMSKLGVSWDVARVGAYKNAPDALTRSTISKEQQESVDALLDTDVRELETALDVSRHLSKQKVETAWKEGLTTPARAKELGLIDGILDPQDLSKTLDELIPGARYDAEYRPADQRDLRWGEKRKIAIVPVIGTITGGKNRDEPLGGEEIAGADSVVRALKRASEDSSVAAIVLRVDSGGGDGMASDLMYRAVLEARKKKPVIASMGDVAASGGYYAAMAADEIWAEPTTITGSIGVFMLKPALEGLGDKLGVHQDVTQRGDLADIIGLYHPWTPEERTAAQRWVDAFYDDFITEVSKSRHIEKKDVDKIARGRVWSGADAKDRKLVDNLGSLLQAIDAARKRVGISEKEDVDLVVVRGSEGLFGGGPSELMDRIFPPQPEEKLPASLRALGRELGIDERELERPGSMRAEMPFKLVVK